MNTPDIDLLLAEKGNPCISIVIPTHAYTKNRVQNPELIGKAVRRAKMLLENGAWPTEKVNLLQSKLDSILTQLDYLRLQKSLAIFVSPNVTRVYLLPFSLKEKVMLGKTFELRDLFYFNQYTKTYYLLTLSRKRTRLFKGSGSDLQEVVNSDFPKQYTEEYEYNRPSIASSSSPGLKGFERDKSLVQESRMKDFFRRADETLNKYLKEDSLLFVAGVNEELADFEQISHHVKNLASKIPGNFDIDAVHPLAESAWKKIKEDVSASHKELIKRLEEDIGKHLVVDGIRNVWKAAMEGKGHILLLEKDYQYMAYQHPDDRSQILLSPPAEGPYDIILDAADDVIEVVKEKGGEIVIVENGELKAYGSIALLLRYP